VTTQVSLRPGTEIEADHVLVRLTQLEEGVYFPNYLDNLPGGHNLEGALQPNGRHGGSKVILRLNGNNPMR
jgi:hypothetical protein